MKSFAGVDDLTFRGNGIVLLHSLGKRFEMRDIGAASAGYSVKRLQLAGYYKDHRETRGQHRAASADALSEYTR